MSAPSINESALGCVPSMDLAMGKPRGHKAKSNIEASLFAYCVVPI